MTLHVNDAGSWKSAAPHVKDGAEWKAVQEVWVNDGGTWKQTFQLAAASVTYSPTAGNKGVVGEGYFVSATSSVVWTWSASNITGLNASLSSGQSGTQISFTLARPVSGSRSSTITLNANFNGVVSTWTFTLEAIAGGGQNQ